MQSGHRKREEPYEKKQEKKRRIIDDDNNDLRQHKTHILVLLSSSVARVSVLVIILIYIASSYIYITLWLWKTVFLLLFKDFMPTKGNLRQLMYCLLQGEQGKKNILTRIYVMSKEEREERPQVQNISMRKQRLTNLSVIIIQSDFCASVSLLAFDIFLDVGFFVSFVITFFTYRISFFKRILESQQL